MMPRKFDDSDLDKAEELRRRGEKWTVVEALLGDGIKGACDYRRTHKKAVQFCSCNQGRMPCTCKPDAWMLKGLEKPVLVLTECEANAALQPGITKHPLFMRSPA
jgi:hypothetical protein